MTKLFALAAITALLAGCASQPLADANPFHGKVRSTPLGASNAAYLGFHGPVDRDDGTDGPN